jgi:hypothetical protein
LHKGLSAAEADRSLRVGDGDKDQGQKYRHPSAGDAGNSSGREGKQ